jgi:hypothetical protein
MSRILTVTGRPCGLGLAGDADADHRGIGRGRDRRLAGDRHQLIERLGGVRRDGHQRRDGDHESAEQDTRYWHRHCLFIAHDLVRKPVPIPDQVEDRLFGIMRYFT